MGIWDLHVLERRNPILGGSPTGWSNIDSHQGVVATTMRGLLCGFVHKIFCEMITVLDPFYVN